MYTGIFIGILQIFLQVRKQIVNSILLNAKGVIECLFNTDRLLSTRIKEHTVNTIGYVRKNIYKIDIVLISFKVKDL